MPLFSDARREGGIVVYYYHTNTSARFNVPRSVVMDTTSTKRELRARPPTFTERFMQVRYKLPDGDGDDGVW